MTDNTHEIRELKYKLRLLAKQNGKQGESIHRLRAELAEVRELNSKIDRGDLRRLEYKIIDQGEVIASLDMVIEALKEELKEELKTVKSSSPADFEPPSGTILAW